jgi:hypothetical protein
MDVNDENIGLMLTGLDQGLESAGRGFDVESPSGYIGRRQPLEHRDRRRQ